MVLGFGKESRIAVRSADSSKELLVLEEETKKVDLSGFSELFLPPEIKQTFSELPFKGLKQDQGGRIIAAGGAAAISQGLYRATVDPATLIQYSDKTIGSVVVSNGKFMDHAGFQAAGVNVFAPIMVYQLMAAVTGQYYLNGISAELGALNSKVDELIKIHRLKQLAEIEVFLGHLGTLAVQASIHSEDLNLLLQIRHSLEKLKSESVKAVELRNPKRMESSLSEGLGNKLKSFEQILDAESPIRDAINVFVAEKALRLADLVEMKVNVQLGATDVSRLRRVQELASRIDGWSGFDSTQRMIEDKVRFFESCAKNTLDSLSKKVLIDNSSIARTKNQIDQDLQAADRTLSKTLGEMTNLAKSAQSIETGLAEKVEYFLAISKGEVTLLGRKS